MLLPRVWAQIDLSCIADNLRACQERLNPGVKVLAVVKADAYGHGAVQVATTLEEEGIAMLGVGDSNEAISLRERGITSPILVLGAVVEGEIAHLIRHHITPTIHSPERIALFNRQAGRLGIRLPVHLLVDTGMGRLGVIPQRTLEHMRAILRAPNLRLDGVGTHLASSLEDSEFTAQQLATFRKIVSTAREAGIDLPTLHVLSSQSVAAHPHHQFDMVRLGGLLYGLSPLELPEGIKPALSLYTQIVYLRDVEAGTPIGYGGTFITKRPARIATLPVGYHDGFFHRLSNRAHVLVRGRRAPVVGRVTMDYVTIDVTDIPGTEVGDRVTLLGADENDQISALDIANWAGTIPYEIPCQLGNRVRRFFAGESKSRRVDPAEPASTKDRY